MFRENTSIAFVVDRGLRVLLWSNGLVEATSLAQETVEGRDVSSLPFLSEDNRDNTTAAIRQLFLNGSNRTGDEEEGDSRRRMVVALAPGAVTAAGATREILLHFTAAYFNDSQHVLCLGRELESELTGFLKACHQDAAGSVSSLTSETPSGFCMNPEMSRADSPFVQPEAIPDTPESSLDGNTYVAGSRTGGPLQ